MQVTRNDISPTHVKLSVSADSKFLSTAKDYALKKLSQDVNVPGFREGSAPSNLVEKHIDQTRLQSSFLEEAINNLYMQLIRSEKLRPVTDPKVELKKFVPFTTLDFEVEVEVVGKIKLPDYKKMKKTKPKANITAKDINEVMQSLQIRLAKRNTVKRPAKNGDEVLIDFKGFNNKKEPVNGADGKAYPLLLGSKTFIPGFEENLLGLKSDQTKSFKIKFPADYNVKALASSEVTFEVVVNSVYELEKPELDDKFAAQAGPFKTIAELKSDIKKQLGLERQNAAERQFENELIQDIADKSEVEIPKILVDQQIMRGEQEEKQNLTYKGQTWQEHLAEEGVTEEEHRERNRATARESVKVGLALSEIASKENIEITPEELEIRIQLLKGQYKDPAMQTELDKPENREDIASRLMTEKTISKLVDYAVK